MTGFCGGAPRSGRPAQYTREEREALIFGALEQVVAKRGLQGASMAAIARAAGMSKRTLYAVFESRDALFEGWVRHTRASFMRPLEPQERELPVRDRLRRLLRRDAAADESWAGLMVLRAVIAEAPRHPELARAFHREGPDAARGILAEELARAVERGEIVVGDVKAAAHMLMDMVHAQKLDCLIDPDCAPPSNEVMQARIEEAIRVFLDGTIARGDDEPQPRSSG